MRPIDTDLAQILNGTNRRVDLKVEIEDADNVMQNMEDFHGHDWIISVDTGDHIDSACADATIVLNRDLFRISLAPLAKESILNLDAAGAWNPILFLNRAVIISVRYAASEDAQALDYIEIFRGNIDTIDWGQYAVTVQCRDRFGRLQDTFIEEVGAYGDPGGEPLEDTLTEILDDWIYDPSMVLHVPASPGYDVLEFESTKQSVADQMIMLADQIGWRVKMRWSEADSQFQLQFYEPDRDKIAVDRVFTDSRYHDIQNLSLDISGIRNSIEVAFTELDASGQPIRTKVIWESATSMDLYGRRFMGVTEAATSIIDTEDEADTFALIMLNDLQFPILYKTVEMPLFAPAEIADLYTFAANDVHYSDATTFCVIGFRHTFEVDHCRTTLTLKEGAPIGRYTSWNVVFGMNGNAPTDDDFVPGPPVATGESSPLAIIVEMSNDIPIHSMGPKNIEAGLIFEIHVTAPGGTPSSSTLVATTKNSRFVLTPDLQNMLPVDELMDVHVRSRSPYGSSTFTTLANKRVMPAGSAFIDRSSTTWTDGISFNFNENNKGTSYPTDGWTMDTGTWGTDAILDDGTVFGGGVSTQYGSKFLVLK